MTTPFVPMTCAEFEALLPDYLEARALDADARAKADAHLLDCAACAALVADVRAIVRDAGELPTFGPSRDLWAGIEARIEAPVVALAPRAAEPVVATPVASAAPVARHPGVGVGIRRLAIAASMLIAVTAGVTYTLARRTAPAPDVAAAPRTVAGATNATPVVRRSAEETYDHEIAALRTMVAQRRGGLDSMTVALLEKNLRLIDRAIAESKAALLKDPGSDFLMDRLNRSYDTKLQVLRSAVTATAGI